MYWLIIGKKVSIAHYYPTFSPLDTIPQLSAASAEIIIYWDRLITCLEKVHMEGIKAANCEWPSLEAIIHTRREVHEDFRATCK
jgi:hypothetical protein